MGEKTDRRSFLGKSLLGMGAAGLGAAGAWNPAAAAATPEAASKCDRPAGQCDKPAEKPKTSIAPGSLACGKIGNVSVSRLFLGGNLIGFCSHSRDLIYVHKLFRAYNTEAKIFETLDIALDCGINTILTDAPAWLPVLKYNQQHQRKMQMMVALGVERDKTKMRDAVRRTIDQGGTLLYCHGCSSDEQMMNNRVDLIGQAVELIKAEGVPAGIGSHSLQTTMAAEKQGCNPDFYVKTYHLDRYWSATPKPNREDWCWYGADAYSGEDHNKFNDNMWCLDASAVAAFMATIQRPWVAFKVMAAGAIHPNVAFPNAYRNGADFIVAGMFDFQVEQDVKIAIEGLHKTTARKRPWHG